MVKKAMVEYIKNELNDLYFTPIEAILPLAKHVPHHFKTIWECADRGNSLIADYFREQGRKVISTDIVTGFNFLSDEPDFDFDCIITNPPFSLKNDFLKKCYEYKKPFALLLPLESLGGVRRGSLFQQFGISVIVLDRRVEYGGKSGCWFNSAWFTYGFGENNKLCFERLIRDDQ